MISVDPVVMVGFLISKGFSEAKIAKIVNASQPTINRIKNGSRTNYDLGKRIELLYLSEQSLVDNHSATSTDVVTV